MFKIEAYVEDKRLADVLKALAGLVRGQPSIVPMINVANGAKKEAKEAPKAKTNGNMVDMFAEHLKTKAQGDTLRASDIGDYLDSVGLSKGSRTYLAAAAVKAKLLRKAGKGTGTYYRVVKK